LIFGSLENIEKFSTNDFLKVFEIDELEDEGELQKFEYPDYFNFGSMIGKYAVVDHSIAFFFDPFSC
jgi:hypothetical protein